MSWMWPCGCIIPPMHPNTISGRPSRSAIAGRMLWRGRRPGAIRFGLLGSSENSAPRSFMTTPVLPATTPAPKADEMLVISETALPAASATHR